MSSAERILSNILVAVLGSGVGSVMIAVSRKFYPEVMEGWAEVSQVRLQLPRLDPAFHGYRVAQISDFHIGTWMNRERLEEAVSLVNQQQPDLVAITGDFVTFTPEKFSDSLAAALSRLQPPDGALAVLGNHDHWSDPVVVRQALAQAGVIDLSNAVHTIRRSGACLHFAGVDDYMNKRDRLDRVLAQLPEAGAAVLLAHEPDYADVSSLTGRFDLQISGHSHGGQVRLPIIGAPFLPRYARRYPNGLYRVGGMHLYTNRGLGTAELQIRINCPAEITIYTLEAGKDG